MINKNYKPGDIIIREHTQGNSAYIVEKGKVEVSMNIGSQRIVFTSLERGSIFGEMSLIDNSLRSATVTAIEDTSVTVVSKTNFQALLRQNKPLESIFKVLAERLRETDQQVNPLKLTNFYFSLSSLILHLARSNGQKIDQVLSVELEYVLDEACTILAVDKELVGKVINRMVLTRLVRIEKDYRGEEVCRNLVIPDEEKFIEWNAFLRANSSASGEAELAETPENAEEAFQVLKVLRDNDAEYDPAQGKTAVNFENYIGQINTLLNLDREKADKILKPYLDAGLFKFTMDRENNTRRLVCNDPGKLENELNKLENLKSYGKMTELLKAMASN